MVLANQRNRITSIEEFQNRELNHPIAFCDEGEIYPAVVTELRDQWGRRTWDIRRAARMIGYYVSDCLMGVEFSETILPEDREQIPAPH